MKKHLLLPFLLIISLALQAQNRRPVECNYNAGSKTHRTVGTNNFQSKPVAVSTIRKSSNFTNNLSSVNRSQQIKGTTTNTDYSVKNIHCNTNKLFGIITKNNIEPPEGSSSKSNIYYDPDKLKELVEINYPNVDTATEPLMPVNGDQPPQFILYPDYILYPVYFAEPLCLIEITVPEEELPWAIYVSDSLEDFACIEGVVTDVRYKKNKKKLLIHFGNIAPYHSATASLYIDLKKRMSKRLIRKIISQQVSMCGVFINTERVPKIEVTSLEQIYVKGIPFSEFIMVVMFKKREDTLYQPH